MKLRRLKKLLAATAALAVAISSIGIGTGIFGTAPVAAADSALLPAFPGAEGGGMYATGGRGGKIYHVTNLNSSGTGSFRDAVSGSNRIVVFDVGGTIDLGGKDVVCKGNITIAGQTAPGGHGITLRNGKIGMGGDNIIVRFISSRPGEKGIESDYDAWGGSAGSNSIIDHCALGWANDEQFGLYSKNTNMTVQYTIVGPSNCVSYHSKGAHGFGAMFGRGQNTWHHNLLCHSLSRNFRGKVVGTEAMDFVNNVIYDWGYQTAYGTMGHINYVNNYLKEGPSTRGGDRFLNNSSGSGKDNYKFYVEGNTIRKKDNSVYSGSIEKDNWAGVSGFDESFYRSDVPFSVSAVNGENVSVVYNAQSAEDAYNTVISYCGPSVNPADNSGQGYSYETDTTRNKIDAQVLYEARTGTGSLTGGREFSTVTDSSVKSAISKYGIQYCDYNSYYPAKTNKQITDSDNDGMPDEWELSRGLNINKDDSAGDYLGQGYTNIEYYINDLTVNAFPEGVVEPSLAVADLGDDYEFAREDAAAISLPTRAVSDPSEITLPVSGSLHGSVINWSSASSKVKIKNNAVTAITRPSDSNESISLVAEITQGEYTMKKYFTITLKSTSAVWVASSGDVGKAAGTKLMDGLYNMYLTSGASINPAVIINNTEYSYYISGKDGDVSGEASGGWSDGKAKGAAFSYKPTEDGFLTAYITALGATKTAYIVEEGAVDYKSEALASVAGASGSEQMLTAKVEKGKTYYVFVDGSKGRFVSIAFGVNAPTRMWKASEDVALGGTLMNNLTANEAMTYKAKNNLSIDSVDFPGCIAGTTNPSNDGAEGAALTYTPEKSGYITVYYKIGATKEFRINDTEGNIVSSYKNENEPLEGETVGPSEYTSTTAELIGGVTYYIYIAGSKAEFYGVSYTMNGKDNPPEPTAAPSPTQMPLPTYEPTPTPSGDTGVYYKVTPKLEGKTVTASVINRDDNDGALFVAAAYENGMVVDVITVTVPATETQALDISEDFDKEYTDVRFYLWSAGSMKPYDAVR